MLQCLFYKFLLWLKNMLGFFRRNFSVKATDSDLCHNITGEMPGPLGDYRHNAMLCCKL